MDFAAGRALLALPEPKNIPGRIYVPVEHESALAALVRANGERLPLGRKSSAARALLAGVARVHTHELPTSFFRFVGQDACELAPGRVPAVLCQCAVGE